MRVTLSSDTAAFSAGMKRAERQAATTASSIKSSLGGIGKTVGAFGIGLAAAGIGGLVAASKAALDYASSLSETAQQMGVTVEQLQVLNRAALTNGASTETMSKAVEKLGKTLGDAQRGSKQAIQAFAAIGINRQQLDSFHQAGDAIRPVMEGIKKLGDNSLQASASTRLMGRAAQELLPLLTQGAAGYDAMTAAAIKSGLITQEQADKADAARDSIDLLAKTLQTKLAIALLNNLPAINSVIDGLAKLIDKAGEAIAWLNKLEGVKAGAANAAEQTGLGLRAAARRAAVGAGLLSPTAARVQEQQDIAEARRNINANNAYVASLNAPVKLVRPASPRGGVAAPHLNDLAGGGRSHRGTDHAEQRAKEAERLKYEMDKQELDGKRDLIEAQRDLTTDTETRNNLALDALQVEHDSKALEIAHNLKMIELDKTVSAEEKAAAEQGAQRQSLLNDQLLDLKRRGANLQAELAREGEFEQTEQTRFQVAKDRLQLESQLAETASERREVELRILDLAYQEKKQALERIQTEQYQGQYTHTEDERNRARIELAGLNQNYGLQRKGVLQSTAGPLEQFMRSLPDTAAKANEALQSVAVEGLQSLTDGLTDAIMGAKSLGEVFQNVAKQIIASLIKIEIEKRIIGPLAKALDSFIGGGSLKGDVVNMIAAHPGTFASGGYTGNMPTSAIAGFVHGGEYVFDAAAVKRLGLPALEAIRGGAAMPRMGGSNDNGRAVVINQHFAPNFAGNAATREDLVLMGQITRAETLSAMREIQRRR